ncbi:MAG: hypothetical protein ACR2L8_02780, partial [Solirubrobacteraceae bacterium]
IIASLALVHVVNRVTVDSDLLRLDTEANLPTWASSLQFGLAGIACLLVAAADRGGRGRWSGVSALLLVLSLDELATLHERLSAEIGAAVAEWIVQPLAGLAAIALLVAAGRQAGGVTRQLLLAAVGTLVAGHLAELATPAPEEGLVAAALKIVEESLEMLMGALVLAAATGRVAALGYGRTPAS